MMQLQDNSRIERAKTEIAELCMLCEDELSFFFWDEQFLAARASRLSNFASLAKVTTIVLGAVIATSGTATGIWGEDNVVVLLLYTAFGVIISAVGGLDAAFKLEARSTARRSLAAEVSSKAANMDVKRKSIAVDAENLQPGEAEALIKDAQKLLQDLTEFRVFYQKQAADAGINLTKERSKEAKRSRSPSELG